MSRARAVVYVLSTDEEGDDDLGFPKVIQAGPVDVFTLDCRLLEVSSLQDLREDIDLAERGRGAAHRLSESDAREVLAFLDGFLERARRLLENTDRRERHLLAERNDGWGRGWPGWRRRLGGKGERLRFVYSALVDLPDGNADDHLVRRFLGRIRLRE